MILPVHGHARETFTKTVHDISPFSSGTRLEEQNRDRNCTELIFDIEESFTEKLQVKIKINLCEL